MLWLLSLLVVSAVVAHPEEGTCGGRSAEEDQAYHQSFGNVNSVLDDETIIAMAKAEQPVGRSRATIMACAHDWVNRRIPYCQACATHFSSA